MLKIKVSVYLGVSLLVLTVYGKDKADPTAPPPTATTTVAQALPKLVDLGAKKCIPCKKMAPILDALSEDYKGVFDVEFIDVWQPENQEKANAYAIKSIPTQIFLDAKGKELWRHEGFISKDEILKKWQAFGVQIKRAAKPAGVLNAKP